MRVRALFGLVLGFVCAPLAALAQTSQPIPGDGGWTLYEVPNAGCYARLAGRSIDTMVMVNRSGKLVISIGHPDFHLGTGDLTAGLRIDQGSARRLTLSAVDNIALVTIPDDLRASVLNAKTLTWSLPNGVYMAAVAGLGKAFQAAIPCTTPARRPLG